MIKSLTFTTMHFTIAFTVAWLLTGDWAIGGTIALVEPAVNSVAYVFHEKIWEKIRKRKEPEGEAVEEAKPVHVCHF